MFYKIKNIFGVSALALMITASNNAYAQGVVMLSEEAMFDDEEKIVAPKLVTEPKTNDADPLENLAKPSEKPASVETPKVNTKQIPEAAVLPKQPEAVTTKDVPAKESSVIDFSAFVENTDGNELFEKMSDIEKQTALLNLELRQEKVRNEIEAIKNQRKQAVQQEIDKEEAKKRQQKEWETNQEKKVLEEQQKLRELDLSFEKIRQERLLNAYKNDMLATNQDWIKHDASLYQQIEGLKKEKQEILGDAKDKMQKLTDSIKAIETKTQQVLGNYKTENRDLKTQISVLKARLDAQERELEKRNPFAEGAQQTPEPTKVEIEDVVAPVENVVIQDIKLANMYAVMEIRGKNGELVAKLINQDGMPFYVKKGTKLQSGHVVEEITSTYVMAEKDSLEDYLYFAAGGILPLEQHLNNNQASAPNNGKPENSASTSFVASDGVPGLGSGMIAR